MPGGRRRMPRRVDSAQRLGETANHRRYFGCNRKGFPDAKEVRFSPCEPALKSWNSKRCAPCSAAMFRARWAIANWRRSSRIPIASNSNRTWPRRAKPSSICASRPVRSPPARRGISASISTVCRIPKPRSTNSHIEGQPRDPKEIFDVFALLDRAADAKSVLSAAAERFPRLGKRSQSIGDFRALLKELDGKILPDGSVAEATPAWRWEGSNAISSGRRSPIQESLEQVSRSPSRRWRVAGRIRHHPQ